DAYGLLRLEPQRDEALHVLELEAGRVRERERHAHALHVRVLHDDADPAAALSLVFIAPCRGESPLDAQLTALARQREVRASHPHRLEDQAPPQKLPRIEPHL